MKNIAKYFGSLCLLLLAVVFISTSKSGERIATTENDVISFVSGDYSNNSYAEVTSVNFNSLSNIATANRRVTRTNKIPSQLQLGDNTAFCFNNEELFFPKITKNSIFLISELVDENYIYVLCCIRI